MEKSLDTPIQYLKSIGPKRAKILNKIGINTIEDLLYSFPRRYEDRRDFTPIGRLKEGEFQNIKAEIVVQGERNSFRRRTFSVFEMIVEDGSGRIYCVWFNQHYLKGYFKVGQTLALYGKVERYRGRLQINSPEFEIIDRFSDSFLNTGRIIPVYTLPEGRTQRSWRLLVSRAIDEFSTKIEESLPYDLRFRHNLLNLAKSLINIHFPENMDLHRAAYQRLSFEEFLIFQIPLALRKLRRKGKTGIAHKIEGSLLTSFISGLPFKLTKSQEEVIAEIKQDLASYQPMQRLLQGDVGSGKTVVATIACLIAIQGGYQAAFMAPTEILAKQHYEKISCQLSAVSYQQKKIKLGLLTSSADKKARQEFYQQIRDGKIDLLIGTHALLEETVEFKNLGLVVIDEQHKFGVGQRALLPEKGVNPDILIMTATPIPRTLAITIYGDLDFSLIKELPPGRLPVKTMHFREDKRSEAYAFAKRQLQLGYQVYIVYPVIDDSSAMDIAGAEKMYRELSKNEFREFKVGLIHGRLKQKEQDEIMLKFKEKELNVLIATTVLEVGIDVANATCIIIEYAQRFGLAQLHQLRGRVGRGDSESFCILISNPITNEAKSRIESMVRYKDGFRIAEEDLRIRGPGDFFGGRQHGLTELKIANPLTQMQLLKKAREEALRIVFSDPCLSSRQNTLLREKLLRRFPEYESLILVG